MKNKKRKIFGVILLVSLLLIFTCPNELDYVNWLEKKHQISCMNDGITFECRGEINGKYEPLFRKSGHIRHVGIYKTTRKLQRW